MRRLKHQLTWGLFSLVLVSVFMNCSPSIQISQPSAGGSSGLASTSGNLSSLATKTQALFQAQCFSCHGVAASGGVTNITNLNHLQTSGLVVAGQPNSSSLLRSISEGRMPPGQPMNSADEKVIYDWIVALGGASSGGGGIGAPGGPVAGGVLPTPTPPVVGGSGGGGVVIDPTFTNVFNVVLQGRCLGCHQAGNAQGGISYSNFTATRQTVTAGNPNASALYTSVANNRMPRGGSALSAAEKELVRAWIAAGALNN